MRLSHFDAFAPVCPACRGAGPGAPLEIGERARVERHEVIEGSLRCTQAPCGAEYPIIDGIPIIMPSLRKYLSDNLFQLTVRDDLSPAIEGMLGDAAGPGTLFDAVRQHTSSYAWDHYGDLDPDEPASDAGAPGATVRGLDAGLALFDGPCRGPTLDVGCAVGRSTFELAARTDDLVLGVDVHVTMLRVAARAARTGRIVYPRRRIGVVYDQRAFDVAFDGVERVDLWACDALALPFASARFGLAVALNVLDCLGDPPAFLGALASVLRPRGRAIVTTPYDWSVHTTPIEAWLGGHSQRGADAGAGEPLLRALLTPGGHPRSVDGLRIVGERADLPWHVRLHDRSLMRYSAHLLALARHESPA